MLQIVDDVVRHRDAGEVVVQISGHAGRLEDDVPGHDRLAVTFSRSHEPLEATRVVDRLALEEGRAGLDLLLHAAQLLGEVGRPGVDHCAR